MTRGLKSAPLAVTPRQVAEVAVAGMKSGKHTVWAPPALRYVFVILRHLPRPIFKRLPL
jgi:decaprenylphospho-beta-D-erythro-pentofuranosid-2-ulose 2-reductase